MRKNNPKIGIIAEDDSDVEATKNIIRKIIVTDNIGFKRAIGKGCGKIKRKCHEWAKTLQGKGCTHLILIHDLDRNNKSELERSIRSSIDPCPIRNNIICIPIEELEAWFLADPEAIKVALNLRKRPIVKGHPESISSPKEHIDYLVKKISKNEKELLNTIHNEKISSHIDVSKLMKCKSFVPLYEFICEQFKEYLMAV